MKEYSGDLNLDVENGHDGVYFVAHAYDIQPKNMQKRVRVFINQLLPGIVRAANEVDDFEFAFAVLGRHAHRFVPKVMNANLYDEYFMVMIAISDTTTQLLEKQQEMVNRARKKSGEISETEN